MRTVRVIYRADSDGWWAESPDVPGYTAIGQDYDEVRGLTHEGLPDFTGEDLDFQETVFSLVSYSPQTISHSLGFSYTNRFVNTTREEKMGPSSTGVLTPERT